MNLKDKNKIYPQSVNTGFIQKKSKKDSEESGYHTKKSNSFNGRLEHSLFDTIPKLSANPLDFGETFLKAKEAVNKTNKLLSKIGCWKRLKVNIDKNESSVKRKKLDKSLNIMSTEVSDLGAFISQTSQTSENDVITNLIKNSYPTNIVDTPTKLNIVDTTKLLNIENTNSIRSKPISETLNKPNSAKLFSSLDDLSQASFIPSVDFSSSKHNNTQNSSIKKSLIWESNSHIAVVSASSNEAQSLLKNIKSLASILCPPDSNGIAIYRFTGSKHPSNDATPSKTNIQEEAANIKTDGSLATTDHCVNSSIQVDELSVNSAKD